MVSTVFKYIAAGVLLSTLGSSASAGPDCRTAFDEPEFAFAAGCLVRDGDRMLMVRHRLSGKLGFPAGMASAGESAQCVAHRETWEETGFDVVVHGMIRRLSTGAALYRCELDGAAVRDEAPAVPPGGAAEISEVMWRDPRTTEPSQWRFPRDYPVITGLFSDTE